MATTENAPLTHRTSLSRRYDAKHEGVGHWLMVLMVVLVVAGGIAALSFFAF